MGFGELKTKAGLEALDKFLVDRSYIEGFQASQVDAVVFQAMSGAPGKDLVNALRWYNHISSYGSGKSSLPGVAKNIDSYGPASAADQKPAADSDSDDLFGDSSSDSEDEELQAKLAAYREKKAKKPQIIAKSMLILDVKPWDDETDMVEMEKYVRTIVSEGLLWGASKLVPVGYGIKKLQISCVVEDDKVGTDFLEEEITKNEDLVQSVDVVAFNKL